ncbi:MAG: ferrous iron transport protein A [Clostridiales bacterium]|nr:ferrous iron transport protein A [Clostridiales bacterium]
MPSAITLAQLLPGEKAQVKHISLSGSIRRRLLDIGLTEGSQVECAGISPFGSPSAYLISEALIAIRKSDGDKIFVQPVKEEICSWD